MPKDTAALNHRAAVRQKALAVRKRSGLCSALEDIKTTILSGDILSGKLLGGNQWLIVAR
jgi:hypothetical protein